MATVQQRPQAGLDQPRALEDALAAVARRLRLARWVRHAARGLLAALAVSLVAVILGHFDFFPDWLPLPAVITVALALGLLAGTVTTFLRPINPMAVAQMVEMRLGLKERLSSALEFERSGSADVFLQLQRRDARDYAQRLKATEAAPIPIPWEAKALPPAALLLVLALIVPNLPLFLPHAEVVERSIVKREGQKLAQTARLIQKTAQAQSLPMTRRAAARMERLAKRMAQGRMDKRQAMARMSRLTQQMQTQQKHLAQQSGLTALNGGKSLAQAGQQLAAALQSQGANGQHGQGASKPQGATKSGSRSQGAQGGQPGAHAASARSGTQGFNVPGKLSKTHGQSSQNTGPNGRQPTPEVQRAAQAMQNNDAKALSAQLKQLGQKTQTGPLTPAQQRQEAADLRKLAQTLQGTGMPQTQQHTQAAAQALARGDKQTAAQELQKAADAAARESQKQEDAQGMQSAQQSLQDGEDEMAGAQRPGDIRNQPSQLPGGQTGQAPGSHSGSGATARADGRPSGGGQGGGRGKPGRASDDGQRSRQRLSQRPGAVRGAPHWLDPHYDPTKNPNYKKLYFGRPQTAGPSQSGPTRTARPGADSGPVTSTVPYYSTVITARKSAESAMDREDIPPAYKSDIAKYFNSLQPQASAPPAAGATH